MYEVLREWPVDTVVVIVLRKGAAFVLHPQNNLGIIFGQKELLER